MKTKTIYECAYCGNQSHNQQSIRDCESVHRKEDANNNHIRTSVRTILNAGNLKQLGEILTNVVGYKVEFFNGNVGMQSNSHSAPRGKKTNFSRRHDLPSAYLGWFGTIRVGTEGYTTELSEAFDKVRGFVPQICTGSGGACEDGLKYSCILWADDFLIMGKKMRKFVEALERRHKARLENDHIQQERDCLVLDMLNSGSEFIDATSALEKAQAEFEVTKARALEKIGRKLGELELLEIDDDFEDFKI